MTPLQPEGALKGLKVLDLTRALAGPFCTMLLADQGADVIKVEALTTGDGTRTMVPFPPEIKDRRPFGGYFQSVNRNKKSIAINLKSDEGREIIKKLVAESDVLVENFRSGVMEGLELSYEILSEINPKLVYAAIRGFGDPRTGRSPYSSWPAYDVIAQAMGGIMSVTGDKNGTPTKVGPGIGDLIPATLAAFGIISAVHHANKTGEGQFIDVAMYDAILAFCERIVPLYSYTGEVPKPDGNAHPTLCPFGVFPASDGHVAIACPGDGFWAGLCAEMGRHELIEDEKFLRNYDRVQNSEQLISIISDWTSQHTKKDLATILGGKIPFGPVQNTEDLFNDPHVTERQMLALVDQPGTDRQFHITNTPIKMTKTQGGVYSRAPLLGEHTQIALEAIGYTEEEIEEMANSGIIQQSQ
ncbi:MAG: CoA transferase [Gammaproteobacteria bacterium]|jgi:crotonobetainyl-CoA:carnitine CoA-transferase CaiB-like acyl-CoA transferase|nr:CoA transferase [Gammaproteobacteria bacterium]|tara:strand:+ start:11822 stop:13063 length:1242 start_codon:yes stop_codon:yes gene_type:complete